MATVQIQDQVSAALKRLPAEVSARSLAAPIGAAEVDLFQSWLINNPGNAQGWHSTGFWADAARSTSWQLLGMDVLISIAKQGMLQRYYGGEILPTAGHKYLTIPARDEAYGMRAGRFTNLVPAFHRVGGKVEAWGLVQAIATEFARGKKRKDGTQSLKTNEVGGLVMYWLVKSVHQEADPSVIPPENLIADTAVGVVEDKVARVLLGN